MGRWLSEIRSLGTFGRMWILGNILFSAGRALIAWPTFGRYGVDPWLFLALDIVTAPPYAIAQAVMVKVLRDKDRSPRDGVMWGLVLLLCFVLPYLYIFVASGSMPILVYVGVAIWMAIFGVLAVLRIRTQVRSAPADEGINTSSA